MVLTIKNFESQNVGPGVVETAPTNLVGVAGTLKATLTWTSATGESGVIWSEEKLVRKEGSAPSNSLDGTVVTTITTKDTYATNGYEDTGLDSTKTYYYKVFAVYDNGTERGSSSVNVTPIFPTKGIFHNETLGLISLSSDGTNWTTIADKNLGATQVYNDGDTLSEANCGKYYQWGNNYGFPWTGATTIVNDTNINTSSYGPGNYYSGSTFLATTHTGSSGSGTNWSWQDGVNHNDNLRGGITDTNNARQGPCASGYHIPSHQEQQNIQTILQTRGLVSAQETSGGEGGKGYKQYLKMPYSGSINMNGTKTGSGSRGYYWSSDVGHTRYWSRGLVFQNNWVTRLTTGNNQREAMSIRPFKNDPVVPMSQRKVLYWTE